ncbi:MAG: ABC transporter ATP-binding protein [Nevskiaceae bacterium]|nr:MAG: ABC transporter ATP-binding protein [Nevskiaceae bacterium]TBR71469.1 MAG: ABC transporter ATP-binding protein [Nevskiaceae bacterium]
MNLPGYASGGGARFLLHYVARRGVSHAIVLGAVLAAVICSVGSQYAVKNLVDNLSGHPSGTGLYGAVWVLLILVGGDNLLWRVAGWVSTYAFVSVGGDIRRDLFNHLSGHGSRYFVDQMPGALAGRITAAANSAWMIENALAWTTIPPGLAVILSIFLIGTVNWQLMAGLVAVVLIIGGIVAKLAINGRELHQRYAGRAARVTGDLTDIVSNMGLVHAFGAKGREEARVAREIRKEMSAQRASLLSLERLRLFHAVTVFAVIGVVLYASVYLWHLGSITTGSVVLIVTLGFTVLHASRDFAMAIVSTVQQFAKLNEAVQVLGLPHEMADEPGAVPLVVNTGIIEFRNLSFSYPNGQSVLSHFDLALKPGEKVGFVGKTGAGKSTIFSLLQRLYDPHQGEVLIDGQDIRHVTQESLSHAIAVVSQDISLFHRPLMENLRYGKPEATNAEVLRAAEAAQCAGFIDALPDGYRTLVGDRGMKLSGGQRQRIAIARAFLRDASIILLDEATSALDMESERLVQAALVRLFEGRTVLAIAHRLSTLDDFDRIVVLDHGRIVEQGSPNALMSGTGWYARLRALQVSGVQREAA